MTLDFAGKDIMLREIDQAVGAGNVQAITDDLRARLCRLIGDERIQLPSCVYAFSTDRYQRRLLHQDARLGYSVMAMTWAPGQNTPIHDHSGMWCVEAVWHGSIEVEQYELVERQGERFRLERRTVMRTGIGSAGSLIPPHEYHTIANPDPEQPAVTLHIYAGAMNECCAFQPLGQDWYLREPRRLQLDAA